MLSLWANWLVTKFGLNSLKRYLWPVLYPCIAKELHPLGITRLNSTFIIDVCIKESITAEYHFSTICIANCS